MLRSSSPERYEHESIRVPVHRPVRRRLPRSYNRLRDFAPQASGSDGSVKGSAKGSVKESQGSWTAKTGSSPDTTTDHIRGSKTGSSAEA